MRATSQKRDNGMPRNDGDRLEEEEPTSVDTKPEVAHNEVPKEDAEMMPDGGPRKKA
jgi:hypothetical protein